ncbi:hypothetical protein KP509_12G038800 [Ceratopteris richardii]|uniref:Uncharacterized protein n=1 Tax=Ceratopteris richardii TaxID=49495 RepID=A0A8T2TIA1_CERRI|nr:hypothetical protein KP509_12G038800 [Ceratopteris richardii]
MYTFSYRLLEFYLSKSTTSRFRPSLFETPVYMRHQFDLSLCARVLPSSSAILLSGLASARDSYNISLCLSGNPRICVRDMSTLSRVFSMRDRPPISIKLNS